MSLIVFPVAAGRVHDQGPSCIAECRSWSRSGRIRTSHGEGILEIVASERPRGMKANQPGGGDEHVYPHEWQCFLTQELR